MYPKYIRHVYMGKKELHNIGFHPFWRVIPRFGLLFYFIPLVLFLSLVVNQSCNKSYVITSKFGK
jgi:ABC-type multidrug transport system permease subunit